MELIPPAHFLSGLSRTLGLLVGVKRDILELFEEKELVV